jgi:mono/diheme cytochrome c family protein
MESTERIQGFDKASLQALEAAEPIMPAFGPERLTDSELDDIVRYLQTLRGFDPTVR